MLIFADDTTLLACGQDPAEIAIQLNRDLGKISDWAKKWKVAFNTSKSKDMIFSKKCLNNSPPLILNNEIINRVNSHKHLGVYLQSNLDWSTQINETCLKANRKLSVLRNIKFLKRKTLDLLYKVIVRSIIDYALPIYANTLKVTELARLERIQYKAAKIVTGALHFTNQDKLNLDLGWESIKQRIDFLGLCFFHKIHRQETRPLIRSCMSKLDRDKVRITRSKGGYLPFKNYGNTFLKSFFPHISKFWNSLPLSTQCLDVSEFKKQLKLDMKPLKIKHNTQGSKIGNCLLTRIRVGRSDLNLHKFVIGQAETPECLCHFKEESSKHYILDCFLYTAERQTLLTLVEHYIPYFSSISKSNRYNILMYGLHTNNPEYNYLNMKITIALQNYILKTKRFDTPFPF